VEVYTAVPKATETALRVGHIALPLLSVPPVKQTLQTMTETFVAGRVLEGAHEGFEPPAAAFTPEFALELEGVEGFDDAYTLSTGASPNSARESRRLPAASPTPRCSRR
jgi:hypothetical protein